MTISRNLSELANQVDSTGTLNVGGGGTGQTTYTDGQLLIGNSSGNTLTKSTLTAGSNITITNGNGSITIASTASGSGDVTGPASSTDNAIARFDGTTGKIIQDSAVTIADTTGSMTFSGSSARIIAPMSSPNAGTDLRFQTSTTNGGTNLQVMPNGTGTTSQLILLNRDGDRGQLRCSITEVALVSSGAFPIVFYNNDTTERMRITTNGGISFGSSGTAYGTSGQILQSNGDAPPTWINNATGTVTSITAGTGLSGGTITSSGTISIDFTVVTLFAAQTLSNKRITPRVSTTASSATPTINTDNVDVFGLTALAVNVTSFTTNLSGTPTDGQVLKIYIVGTAARTLTWGASFESSTVTLPTTTVSTNRLDVGFIWNAATSKWRCVAVA